MPLLKFLQNLTIIMCLHRIYTVKRPFIWWNSFCQCTCQKTAGLMQVWLATWYTYVIAAKQAQAILTKLRSGTNDYSYIVMWWILLILAHHAYKTHNQSAPDVDSLASNFANKLSLSADLDSKLSNVIFKKLLVSKGFLSF